MRTSAILLLAAACLSLCGSALGQAPIQGSAGEGRCDTGDAEAQTGPPADTSGPSVTYGGRGRGDTDEDEAGGGR